MKLTADELQQLRDDGFAVIRDVLPEPLRVEALRAINHCMASTDVTKHLQNYEFMAELRTAKPITDLFHRTPVRALAESLIGPGTFSPDVEAQFALRFPSGSASGETAQGWHLDSLMRGDGSRPTSGPANFTLLIGFCLSDTSTPGRGNFTVRPGGHQIIAEFFREHGADAIDEVPKRVQLPPPVEVCANAGDVIFCHHQVPHTASPNSSADIRYMVFIRLRRHGRDALVREAMTDPFYEWDGMV